MDRNQNNEAKNRRREELLARRLAEALDQRRASGANGCPDAEIIATYAEQGLGPDESAHWEDHFAGCDRCRTILRVLTVSADAPLAEKEVARLGELAVTHASAQVAPPVLEPKGPMVVDWRLRWLAPALGVAAVLAVWFAMRPPWKTTEQGASTTLIAQAPKEQVAAPAASGPTDQASRVQPQGDEQALKSRSRQPNAEGSALDSRSKVPAGGGAAVRDELRNVTGNQIAPYTALQKKAEPDRQANEREARPQASPPPPPAAPAPAQLSGGIGTGIGNGVPAAQSDAKSSADLSSHSAAASPAAPPIPPKPSMSALARSAQLPEARAKADKVSPAAPDVSQQTNQSVSATAADRLETPEAPNRPGAANQTVTVTEAAPTIETETTNGTVGGTVQPGTPADLPLNGRSKAPVALLGSAQKSVTLFRSPSGSVVWRTASGSRIERSNDSGRTWQTQVSPSQEDWLAGAAVSDTVCWLAGRKGAIARTLDGEHWEIVGPPPQAAAADGSQPDWPGITARDTQTATVTAAGGRRFITQDGGKTWQPQ